MASPATLRQQIIALLHEATLTSLDISQEVRIPEKEVCHHLGHIMKSVPNQGGRLDITPSVCLACGYTFRQRRRFTRPGRCPNCRESRISRPAFSINKPNHRATK